MNATGTITEHTSHLLHDGMYHRFITNRGIVWVKVEAYDVDTRTARAHVYEQDAMMASIGYTRDEAHKLPVVCAARNHFGTGLVLRMFRAVRESMPEVKRWVWERKQGINNGRWYERGGTPNARSG